MTSFTCVSLMNNPQPFRWIPSLFFAQGVSYAVISVLAIVFLKDFGLHTVTIIALTSLLLVPWCIKPLLSPLIESVFSKRSWTVLLEFCISISFVLLAITSCFPQSLHYSAILFMVIAFLASLHDIAADGVYLLSLPLEQQFSYVGVQCCAFQSARLFIQGGLIVLAGAMTSVLSLTAAWAISFALAGLAMFVLAAYHFYQLPKKLMNEDRPPQKLRAILITFRQVVREWFSLPYAGLSLIFVFCYNAADAQLMRISPLFLMDSVKHGGLNMNTATVGLLQSCAVVAIAMGAVFAGWLLKHSRLRKSLIVFTLLMLVTNAGYWLLSGINTPHFWIVVVVFSLAQLVFGICNSLYMATLMQMTETQKYRSSFYALCTSIMTMSFMFFGFISAPLKVYLSYSAFFAVVVGANVLIVGLTWVYCRMGLGESL